MKAKAAKKPWKKAVPLEEDERIVAGTLKGAKSAEWACPKASIILMKPSNIFATYELSSRFCSSISEEFQAFDQEK